jgi:hypothetical protein
VRQVQQPGLRAQRGGLLLDCLAGTHALRDVAHEGQDEAAGCGGIVDRAEGDLECELLARVGHGGHHHARLAVESGDRRRRTLAPHARAPQRLEQRGDERFDALADRLLGRVAEQPLGAGIPQDDPAPVDIDDDHRLGQTREQAAEAQVVGSQRLVPRRPAQRWRAIIPCRDVRAKIGSADAVRIEPLFWTGEALLATAGSLGLALLGGYDLRARRWAEAA